MAPQYIYNLEKDKLPASIGGKAKNLQRLRKIGVRLPKTFILPAELYARYSRDDLGMIEQLRRELQKCILPSQLYAVRSSADMEDGAAHSFAGQFKSVLNVQGVDSVLQSIWAVWATTQSSTVNSYQQELQTGGSPPAMGIIIQEMVNPILSGVSFSKNPITGAEEIIIEAVRGLGTKLVQEGETPLRWIYTRGTWQAYPQEMEIDQDIILTIAKETQRIAKAFKQNVDCEWVYNGKEIFWVQVREITTLNNLRIYSNRISREMLPGMIKPLVWSINIPLVNTIWIQLLEEIVGKTNIQPEDLAKPFYYRTYFNMGLLGQFFSLAGFPPDGLESMMGLNPGQEGHPPFKPGIKTIRLAPRLLAFIWDKWHFEKKYQKSLRDIDKNITSLDLQKISELDEKSLLEGIERLYQTTIPIIYLNIVVPLLMFFYNGLLSKQLKSVGVDFTTFDLTEGISELDQYNPTVDLNKLAKVYHELPEELKKKIKDDCSEIQNVKNLQVLFDQFIEKYGHLSDSGNDFSVVPWRENPKLVLNLIAEYKESEEVKKEKIRFSDIQTNILKKAFFKIIFIRARRFTVFREQISSRYTYSYGVFHNYFLALGQHFVTRGLLVKSEDIFYLTWEEVKNAVHSDEQKTQTTLLSQCVAQRKEEMEKYVDIQLPPTIYGDSVPPLLQDNSPRMVGIPTSRGYFRGRVKVIRSSEDFKKMEKGDVLVVPYSDVSWTVLFPLAGAVVAESGGMLSHSSIVAREFNIPAVVSVSEACRLKDHQWVTVDGFKGEVILDD